MREVKFRAFDTTSRKMYSQKQIEEYTLEQLHRIGFGDDYTKFMQYTGLKDKNGVEIYEGDIVYDGSKNQSSECISGVHEVKYENGGFFPFAVSEWECTFSVDEGVAECLVIGNIYENPELLK